VLQTDTYASRKWICSSSQPALGIRQHVPFSPAGIPCDNSPSIQLRIVVYLAIYQHLSLVPLEVANFRVADPRRSRLSLPRSPFIVPGDLPVTSRIAILQ
jgi:hypothetical protein